MQRNRKKAGAGETISSMLRTRKICRKFRTPGGSVANDISRAPWKPTHANRVEESGDAVVGRCWVVLVDHAKYSSFGRRMLEKIMKRQGG